MGFDAKRRRCFSVRVDFSNNSMFFLFELDVPIHPVIPPEVRCLDGMFWGSKYLTSGGGPGCLECLSCWLL